MINNIQIIRLSQALNFNQIIYAKKVYNFLFSLNFEYPKFHKWFWNLFTDSGILKSDREILICIHDSIIMGVSILKRSCEENKICTLRVGKRYQNMGIGSRLLEKSFEFLKTEKPLITIHVSKFHEFEKMFNRYNFNLEQEISGYYGFMKSELSYNGILNPKSLNENNTLVSTLSLKLEKLIYCYPESNKIFIPTNKISGDISLLIT